MNTMKSKKPKERSEIKNKLYNGTDFIWPFIVVIWTLVIITFLVSYAANLAIATSVRDNNLIKQVVPWLLSTDHKNSDQVAYYFVIFFLIFIFVLTACSLVIRHIWKPPTAAELQNELLQQILEKLNKTNMNETNTILRRMVKKQSETNALLRTMSEKQDKHLRRRKSKQLRVNSDERKYTQI